MLTSLHCRATSQEVLLSLSWLALQMPIHSMLMCIHRDVMCQPFCTTDNAIAYLASSTSYLLNNSLFAAAHFPKQASDNFMRAPCAEVHNFQS